MDILNFAIFLLPGLLVGFTGIRYLARSLVFTIPFTRKLESREIHRHPEKTRMKTFGIMAAILVADILVCIAVDSYFSIVSFLGYAFGQILPLAFSSNVFVTDSRNVDRYVAANRAYLDLDAFAVYITETSLNSDLVAKYAGGLYENRFTDHDAVSTQAAAEQGNADAQYMLGLHHLSGKYVEKNPSEAMRWLLKAAAQDHAPAKILVERMKDDGGEAYSNMIRSMMRAKSFEEQVEVHGPGMTIPR